MSKPSVFVISSEDSLEKLKVESLFGLLNYAVISQRKEHKRDYTLLDRFELLDVSDLIIFMDIDSLASTTESERCFGFAYGKNKPIISYSEWCRAIPESCRDMVIGHCVGLEELKDVAVKLNPHLGKGVSKDLLSVVAYIMAKYRQEPEDFYGKGLHTA